MSDDMSEYIKPLPPKPLSAQECQIGIRKIQDFAREMIKPYIDRLVEIEMQQPPKPFMGEDGKMYEYIGPWPVKENTNL